MIAIRLFQLAAMLCFVAALLHIFQSHARHERERKASEHKKRENDTRACAKACADVLAEDSRLRREALQREAIAHEKREYAPMEYRVPTRHLMIVRGENRA